MPKKVGVRLYKRDNTKYWWYYFRYGGQSFRGSTDETDRRRAEEIAYRRRFEITKRKKDEQEGNIPVQELFDKFLEHTQCELRQETLKSYRSVVNNFKVFLNEKYPRIRFTKDITDTVVGEFKLARLRSAKKTTARNNIKVIKTVFKWAKEKGFIDDDPALPVKNISKSKAREDQKHILILTLDEFEAFSTHVKEKYPFLYPLYLTYVYTGAREKELYSLKWSDIDFDRKVMMIRAKDGFVPKTEERDIPLHNKLVDILSHIPRVSEYIFTDNGKPYIVPDSQKKKGYYESHKPYRYLGKIMKELGRPEFTRLHWLRHSFATIITKERGIKFAQEMLGHKDISITQRYVHYDRDYIQDNMNNIEELNRIFK
jgi:integrase